MTNSSPSQPSSSSPPSYSYELVNPFLNAVFARNVPTGLTARGQQSSQPGVSAKLKDLRQGLIASSSYTFVVPKTSILEWCVDKDTLLPYKHLFLQDDYILSHIIQVPPSLHNNQRARYFGTVNAKTVIIKDGFVYTHKGFQKFVRAPIVREYMFYPACNFLPANAQFLVYEIEIPLMGTPAPSIEVSPTVSAKYELPIPSILKGSGSGNGVSKLSSISSGGSTSISGAGSRTSGENSGIGSDGINDSSNASIGNSAGKVKEVDVGSESGAASDSGSRNNPADLERMLSAYTLLSRQVLGPLLRLIEEFDCSNCTSEDEILSSFDAITEEAIDIFKSGDSASIQAMARDNDLSGDDITDSIYRFVESSLSEQLWKKLVEIRDEADLKLRTSIETIKFIDIGQIGLPDENLSMPELFNLDKKVWLATEEIIRLSQVSSAEDKIEIILSVIRILSDDSLPSDGTEPQPAHKTSTFPSQNGNIADVETKQLNGEKSGSINADVLVSLLLLVVCRSGLKTLDTDLFYARNFTYRDSESGQLGYALLTLEGVLFHIVNDSNNIAPLSDQNYLLWEYIKNSGENQTDVPSDPSAYLNKLSKEIPSWISIVRSRSPIGESCLTLAIQNNNIAAFRAILSLQEINNDGSRDATSVIGDEYLFNDSTMLGATLLITAVYTEDRDIISEVLDVVMSSFDESQQKKYFGITDKWKRSVSHYFFHAPWLIDRIGHLISWEQRDQNGQTPLFALCRSYDNADYDSLMASGFKVWSQSVGQQRPSILDHIDSKGNTLLHIVKDKHAVKQVLKYDVDVNWPNERGMTPLMVYSKYSRLGAIVQLCADRRVDLERTDNRGLNALDIAKEIQTSTILDGKYKTLFIIDRGGAPEKLLAKPPCNWKYTLCFFC